MKLEYETIQLLHWCYCTANHFVSESTVTLCYSWKGNFYVLIRKIYFQFLSTFECWNNIRFILKCSWELSFLIRNFILFSSSFLPPGVELYDCHAREDLVELKKGLVAAVPFLQWKWLEVSIYLILESLLWVVKCVASVSFESFIVWNWGRNRVDGQWKF